MSAKEERAQQPPGRGPRPRAAGWQEALRAAAVPGAIGAALLTLGLAVGWRSRSFLSKARSAEGMVVRFVERDDNAYPVVRYRAGGEDCEIEAGAESSPRGHAVGEAVTVVYEPGRPAQGRIRSFKEQYLAAAILCGLAAPFAAAGLFFGWRALRGAP